MKSLAYVDRGAVLFVGIAVGAVLAMSYVHQGQPFASMAMAGPAKARQEMAAPPAQAATPTDNCAGDFPLSPRVLAGLRADRPLRIGIIGDSFGDGIFAATNGMFRKKDGFEVYRFSKEGTGLTRYQSLDVLDHVKAKFAEQPIDIAIIDIGANDTQGVREAGHGAAYMSERWQSVVGGRASALVAYLRQQGVAVAWVGLPRMRKADYDRDVQAMNGFYAGLMCKLHVPFVNPVSASEDKDHHFAKELIDSTTKTPYVARAEDGIHMTFHGYREITKPVLTRIALLAKQDGPDEK
ncbi:GDSL-type esterase/lipase family protein [Novosphingobium humi]|uniref:SGNH hydrolase-type esterase domain-containing protein n=1 Tax=Novosphingobium humi TaxID=2282397 RepID=A0ABY7U439_9SPHN|nr:GDSL-type esterase/lipase family protein [Novosphingobium humi]WCT80257.1 hypothetical protein PQ457_22050 [Novosphingobium humi]